MILVTHTSHGLPCREMPSAVLRGLIVDTERCRARPYLVSYGPSLVAAKKTFVFVLLVPEVGKLEAGDF